MVQFFWGRATEINLKADTTEIRLPDGSIIKGQTTYTKSDGTTGTVADTQLQGEIDSNKIVKATTSANGLTIVTNTAFDKDGAQIFVQCTASSMGNRHAEFGGSWANPDQCNIAATCCGKRPTRTTRMCFPVATKMRFGMQQQV